MEYVKPNNLPVLAPHIEISTNRFLLRPLTPDDVSDRYASWFGDQAVSQYISAAVSKQDLGTLREYVRERSGREDVLFLGIFEGTPERHIGNIKYEPVNSKLGYAIMGILIGEPDWRGKSVAAEVITASAGWLRQHCNIKQIVLGVSRANITAVRAYKKIGFVEKASVFVPSNPPEGMTMVWRF